jgi:hypothetical protein
MVSPLALAEASVQPAPEATNAEAAPPDAGAQPAQSLADKWGIEVVALRLTAAGHMIDFRYKILDPKKATALMDRDDKPVLIHQGSGKRTGVPVPPKVGRLRQRSNEPKLGRHYFMLFANPGHYFKAGDQVTIEIGGFRAENLIVEG